MRLPRGISPHRPHPAHLHLDRLSVSAVLCPPLAVALSRGWDHLLLNVLLTLCLWVPGVIHALWVVAHYHPYSPEYSTDQIVAALRNHIRR